MSPTRQQGYESATNVDFFVEQPSKKRKIQQDRPAAETAAPVRRENLDSVFDLSSDIELPSITSPERGVNSRAPEPALPEILVDDIVFSSSAPVALGNKRSEKCAAANVLELSSDSLPDDPLEGLFSASQPTVNRSAGSGFTESTSKILASLERNPLQELTANTQRHCSKSGGADTSKQKSMDRSLDNIFVSSPPKPQPRKSKTADSALKRAEKEAEKAAQKERKDAAKAQKAREKQRAADLAEVNKSKLNKKDAVAEMLVEVSGDLQSTSVGNQMEEHMKNLQVPLSYFEQPVTLDGDDARLTELGGIIRWCRTVTAAYDHDAGQWVPTKKTTIKQEHHVLLYLKAQEFAMIAAGYSGEADALPPSEAQMRQNFDFHVSTLRSRYPNCTIIYLIEGMQSWLKKNQNARNREYAAAVRSQHLSDSANEPSTSQPKPRQRKPPKSPPIDLSFLTEDTLESLSLHLQLHHKPLLIQHTTSPATTSLQILAFTQHLSTRPYRQLALTQNLHTASFCTATGQVRTGDDAQDTYIKMLQEIQRVTPSIAYGIAGEYRCVRELVGGFRREGNLVLEDIRKSTNRDGGWTDQRVGPAISRRLGKVFMGRDPGAMDGMS